MNDVIEKYYINDEEINASTYQRALEKVLDWNGISVTTKEICTDCGNEYFENHKCI